MKLFGLKLLTFEGEHLGFKKVTLRIVYFFLLYITPLIILFLINFSINNLELNRLLDRVAYWFVFFNPLFIGGVLFSFFNSQKATIYDFAVRGSYRYDLNYENEVKLDSEITYVDPNINKKQLYLSQILDLFFQLIIILGGNFLLNNFFDPSLGVSNNSFVNFFVNFLILTTFVPLLYTFISLQNNNKSIGMVLTKLNLETKDSKRLILRNLIFTYLVILLIEILLGFYSY